MTVTSHRPVATEKRAVVLVDDHPVLREGLARMLDDQPDFRVVAQADNATEALRQVRQNQPNLIVLDLSLGGTDGLELAKQFHDLYPKLPVLILSQHDETLYAERALRAGAMGYIMKQESPDRVIEAMRTVLDGKVWVSPKLSALMLQGMRGGHTEGETSPLERLSNRELEVFRLIGQGNTVKAIADTLFLSPKTVETHKEHIKQKLGLKSGNQLLQYAIESRNSFK
jgi:DNA-binding NarL/FixJ family response regulator